MKIVKFLNQQSGRCCHTGVSLQNKSYPYQVLQNMLYSLSNKAKRQLNTHL